MPRKIISLNKEMSLRLIQPNILQNEKWDKTKTLINLSKLIDLTKNHYTKSIDLVIWPETAVLFDIFEQDNKNLLLKEGFKNIDNVIIGGIRKEKFNNKNKIYNSLFLIDNNFSLAHYHDKLKLVPFGEYIPLRNLLINYKILLGGIDFSPGESLKFLELANNVKILPLICYEVIFPKITKLKKNNHDLIVNITNDAWFGDSRGPYQHLALSKIRAVLEGKYMVRVANTGISAIIDYNGKILGKINLNKSGVINKKLVLYKSNTLYNYIGDAFFYTMLVVLILILIIINYKSGVKRKYD